MPRKGNMTLGEIAKAEEAAEARRTNRNNGFKLMRERDFGQHLFSNGVEMKWHVPKAPIDTVPNGYVYPRGVSIPADCFVLEADGKEYLFNTEEFRKWLRWA